MKTTWTLGVAAGALTVIMGAMQIAACSSSSSGGTPPADSGADAPVTHPDSGAAEAGPTGPCSTQCASSFCAAMPTQPQSGDPCDTCVNNAISPGGTCNTTIKSACQADKDCVALLTCINGSQTKNPPGCPLDGGLPPPDAAVEGGITDQQCDQYEPNTCIDCCSAIHQQGVVTFNTALGNCVCGM